MSGVQLDLLAELGADVAPRDEVWEATRGAAHHLPAYLLDWLMTGNRSRLPMGAVGPAIWPAGTSGRYHADKLGYGVSVGGWPANAQKVQWERIAAAIRERVDVEELRPDWDRAEAAHAPYRDANELERADFVANGKSGRDPALAEASLRAYAAYSDARRVAYSHLRALIEGVTLRPRTSSGAPLVAPRSDRPANAAARTDPHPTATPPPP